MRRPEDSTDCRERLNHFDSMFALFHQRAHLSNLVRTSFQSLWD